MKEYRGIILVLALFIIFVWFGSGLLMRHAFPNPEVSGQMGDMFGAVNALFSGWALTGVVVAIWLQSKELRLQREELEDTRKELKGQKKMLEKQSEIMGAQKAEDSFYKLLHSHLDAVKKYRSYEDGRMTEVGADKFHHVYSTYEGGRIVDVNTGIIDKSNETSFKKMHDVFKSLTIPYFGRLELLLTYINNHFDPKDQIFYTDIVKSHMTEYETKVIGLYEERYDGLATFFELVKKYRLLSPIR